MAAQQAAESQLSLARSGAQKEDKESAAALVTAARGGVAEVESLLEDQYLTAPCDGQIDQIYPQPGELVSLGAPIMSLLKIDDKWVTFNVREELLSQMKLGDSITVEIPALDRMSAKARIYYVRDMGQLRHLESHQSHRRLRCTHIPGESATGKENRKSSDPECLSFLSNNRLRPSVTSRFFNNHQSLEI